MTVVGLITMMGCATSTMKSSTNEPPKEKELSEIHTDLATSALMSDDLPRAIENLRIAIEYNKNNHIAHNHMGLALLGRGKRDDALKSFLKALDIDPKYSDASVNVGTWYFSKGDYETARKFYERALDNLEYKRRFLPLTSLGHIELTLGNYDKAKEYLFQAINEAPDYCLAHMLLGNIYFRENRLEKAANEYKLSVKGMCVRNIEGQYELGVTYFRLKQFERARQAFNQIVDQFPNSPIAVKAGEKLREMP
jgi:type IV pilus biogenesis/stability protein PilW